MTRCIKCGVYIADKTDKCPLCQQVVADVNNLSLDMNSVSHTEGYKGVESLDGNEVINKYGNYNIADEDGDRYPDVKGASRKYRLLENIMLFLSIVGQIVLTTVDYMADKDINWSIIVLLVLIYANVTLRLAIVGKNGYIFKTVSTFVFTLLLLVGIDLLTGDRGWALTFVFPGAIIALVIGTIVLMIVNHRNWQSYMMMQIFLVLMSAIAMILVATDVIWFPYLAMGAMGASLFLFLGTLIIGERRARTELKRRFHV